MNFGEAAWIALGSVRSSPLRSFLALLGIIIGIASVISVASVINGLNIYVAEKLSNLGPNVFVVTKFGILTSHEDFLKALRRNRDLRVADGEAVAERCPLAEVVGIRIRTSHAVRREREEMKDVEIAGVTAAIVDIEPYDVAEGRNMTDEENERAASVAFVGNDVVERLFPNADPIGKTIRIKNRTLTVVGAAKKRGSVFGFSRDNFVMVPLRLFQRMFGSYRTVDISVKAASGELMEATMDQVRALLRARHHLSYKSDDDFGIISAEGLNTLWQNLTRTIFAVATFVVGISIIVGGIVIMNIMLVSVLERTREIGLRKALGARNRDIRRQFLVECVVLSCVGGFVGILGAFVLTAAIAAFTPLPARFPLWAPFVAFGISSATGIFFGIHPARRAAGLNPIEALRVE